MWKSSVKHKKCALSFKMDNGGTHAVAGMIGVFKGFDLRMAGEYLMYFFFEFTLAEAVDDTYLYLAFYHGIVEGCIERFELKFDGVFVVFFAAFELCIVDMQVYLFAEHRGIGLAASHGISSTHHVAAQEVSIEFL